MASVMLFPNVATHRKMPHLSKEPKESKEAKAARLQNERLSTQALSTHLHEMPTGSDSSTSQASTTGAPTTVISQLAITSSTSTASGGQRQLQSSASEAKDALTINTHSRSNGNGSKGVFDSESSSTAEATTPGTGFSSIKSAVTPHFLLLDPNSSSSSATRQGDRKPHEQEGDALHGGQRHSTVAHAHQQQLHPLNGPHGFSTSSSSATTPLSALPPSGASSTSSLHTHEAKLIKSALYDAFGCLHHPVQHTHHPSSASSASSSSVTNGRLSCATVAALRSGEATPLIGISPRDSPMLRPHMGPSAPITPLELSSDGHAGGYFGLSTSGSSSSTRHLHTHHPHAHGHQHQHQHGRRASSHHYDELYHHNHHSHHHPQQHHGHGPVNETQSPKSLSRKPSLDFNLNPTEHPVLCSLHTLSLTHPHPPEHYHPHLGHDLGHDRIPILPVAGVPIVASAQTIAAHTALTATQPLSLPQLQEQMKVQAQHSTLLGTLPAQQQAHPSFAPSEVLSTPSTTANAPGGSSPFPMDHVNGSIDSGFNQQRLV